MYNVLAALTCSDYRPAMRKNDIFLRIFMVIFFVCLAVSSVRADERNLLIVFEEYPPYEYVEDGQAKGLNIDLIREAFSRMGETPTFEPRPWKRAVLQLQRGDIFALSSGFKTPERETFAYFPSEPLAIETNVIATSSRSALKMNSLKGLRGLRLGVVHEYVYGQPFDSMTGFMKVRAHSAHQLVKMLLNNRMDAAIGNKMVFRHIANEMGQLDTVKFIYEVGNDPLYLLFSRARGDEAKLLSTQFGKAIRSMHKDGTFAAIRSKY